MAGIMDRQETLKLKIPKAVAVVGCGGVGSWTAYFLALAGVPELWLFDMDTISDHNLNRIPLPMSSVGKKKTEAIAELIKTVRPDCVVLTMGWFTPELAKGCQLDGAIEWIVATTDTLASRQLVHSWADKYSINYIEAAAEGEFGSCTGEPAEWATPQEALPGYQSVPVWVGPCVFSAGIAVAHIIHNTQIGDRAIRLGWQNEEDTNDGDYLEARFEMYDSAFQPEDEQDPMLQPIPAVKDIVDNEDDDDDEEDLELDEEEEEQNV